MPVLSISREFRHRRDRREADPPIGKQTSRDTRAFAALLLLAIMR
jgi:hypothetical protein